MQNFNFSCLKPFKADLLGWQNLHAVELMINDILDDHLALLRRL